MSSPNEAKGPNLLPQCPLAPAPSPPPPKKRRGRKALVFLAGLVLLVFVAPAIIAHTPLLDMLVHTLTADLEGRATVQSASLGWLSPVRLGGIEVRDAEGRTVLTAAEAKGTTPLLKMLLNLSNVGEFQIEKPILDVVLRPDGSNVEDLIATYLAKETPEDETGVTLVLKVVDGTISLTDATTKQTWKLKDLQASVSMSGNRSPLVVETLATIDNAAAPGRLAATIAVPLGSSGSSVAASGEPAGFGDPPGVAAAIPASSSDTASDASMTATSQTSQGAAGPETVQSDSQGKADLKIEAFPLAMLDSVLARFAPGTHLAGQLTSTIHVKWGERVVVQADVLAQGFTLATPSLGADRVHFDRLSAVCEISQRGDRIEVVRSAIECDAANLDVSGVVELGDSFRQRLPASALEQTCEIHGRVDLARLAQMLPNTLRIRDQTRIASGEIKLALVSRPGTPASDAATLPGMVWQGRLEAANLTAVDAGRAISWQRPILLTFAAHQTPNGPAVDEVKCESDFLRVNGAGTADNLSAAAAFDLKQLADQLGQFVDLGGLQFAGNGWANFNWKYVDKQKFEADVDLQLRDFRLAVDPRHAWSERELLVFVSAAGRTDFAADTQIDAGSLQARAGEETISLKLTQPVLDFRRGGTWPVKLSAQGKLEHWPERLKSWFQLGDWSAAGTYDLAGETTGSIDGATVREATLNVDGLQVVGPSVHINEPKVALKCSGGWDQQKRALHLEPASLGTASLAVDVAQLNLALPADKPMELTGQIAYRGDLRPVLAWFADPKQPASWQLTGKVDGKAAIRQNGENITADTAATVQDFAAAGASGKTFSEPAIQLAGRCGYNTSTGVVRIDQLNVTSSMIALAAAGQIAEANKQTAVQLDGQVQYDLDKLSTLLATYIGSGVHFSGKGAGPASYRGPISPTEAQAAASLGWQSANVYGFPVGPAQVNARLAGGVLETDPIEATVSQGRMSLAPRVQLKDPMVLVLPPGPLLAQVQITPQMCDALLKYAVPVLAGVTQAQGAFSVELENCQIPLADWTRSDVAGRFIVHSVEIGAGPMVHELAVLLGYAAPGRLRRESVVPFRMVDGRIYHQNLELEFPELTIRTQGSVGVDQTISLIAEMPVPPKWIGNNALGAALRNQTIRVPLTGTLSKPQLDRRVLDQLWRQFAEKTARSAVEEHLKKNGLEGLQNLENLFRRR